MVSLLVHKQRYWQRCEKTSWTFYDHNLLQVIKYMMQLLHSNGFCAGQIFHKQQAEICGGLSGARWLLGTLDNQIGCLWI